MYNQRMSMNAYGTLISVEAEASEANFHFHKIKLSYKHSTKIYGTHVGL